MTEIEQQVTAVSYEPAEIRLKTRAIYEAMMRESRCIRQGNFDRIAADDVRQLYRLYDASFFGGLFERLLRREGEGRLSFTVSSRMTRAGGKMKVRQLRVRAAEGTGMPPTYELAVSATLLFQTFREEQRPIVVAGIRCADRLEALQRIVEHEMLHLLEFLVWRQSSCSQERFQRLARNLFGHTDVKHQLVTPREVAGDRFGLRVGARVAFEYGGVRHTGIVNRITQRATVLVEDSRGRRYSDGKHYLPFYVPLSLLERVGGEAEQVR